MFINQINILIPAVSLLLLIKCTKPSDYDDDDEYVSHRYYCRLISCSNPSRHVLCLYPRGTVGESCGDYFKLARILEIERKAILDTHVKIRKQYASRKKKNITFPEMQWDDDLEEMAQRWAEQCRSENDECRSIRDYGYVVKQNVGHYSVVDYLPHLKRTLNYDLKKIVKHWSEMPYNPANPSTETYQPIDRIGCGLAISRECDWFARITQRGAICRNYYHLFLVCNYAISHLHFHVIRGPDDEY